jgi:hypothetical protein
MKEDERTQAHFIPAQPILPNSQIANLCKTAAYHSSSASLVRVLRKAKRVGWGGRVIKESGSGWGQELEQWQIVVTLLCCAALSFLLLVTNGTLRTRSTPTFSTSLRVPIITVIHWINHRRYFICSGWFHLIYTSVEWSRFWVFLWCCLTSITVWRRLTEIENRK